jgi:hypothetical protein
MVIWEVLTRDGIPLCQCGCEQDAIAIASFVTGRTYRRLLRLAPEIIDVVAIVDGQLPGNLGLPQGGTHLEGVPLILLTQGKGAPLQCAGNV